MESMPPCRCPGARNKTLLPTSAYGPITRSMMTCVVALGHRFLRAWVELMQRTAMVVVLVTICFTMAAGWYVISHFKINTNTSDMLSRDLPFRKLSEELDTAFPQFSDTLMIVIDGETPDLADQATLRLADRLRRLPNLFGAVHDPAGDSFFHRHSLLYMDITALERLSDRLARAQPFLSTLSREPTLKGLADILVLALGEESNMAGRVAALPILRQMAVVVEALAKGQFARLNWERVMQGRDAASSQRRVLMVQPPLDFTTLHPARPTMVALQVMAIELNMTPAHGVQVRLTGSVALAEEELESVETSIGFANIASIALVITILIIGIKVKRFVFSILFTLIVGLILTSFLALLIIGSFNIISVAFAVLFIGLGVDFGIHFCLRYMEGHYKSNAAVWATTSVFGPLTLTAMGAAIGFFSFLPTPYQGFAELGLIAGVGMFIALLTNLTVLPALLSLMPLPAHRPPHQGHTSRVLRLLTWLVDCHARILTSIAALLVLLSITVIPATRFDLDPLNLKDHETDSVRTLRDLMQDEHWSPQSIIMLAESPTQAHALAQRLSHLPTVANVTTISDYVPLEQKEKLRLIDDMATFLSPLFVKGHLLRTSTLAVQQSLAALKQTLLTAPPLLENDSLRLQIALRQINLNDKTVLQALETALLATLPRQLELLRQGLQAGPVTLANLPPNLCTREITLDGRTRVVVRPKDDLTDREALRLFVKTVQAVVPRATGAPVSLYESGETVVKSFLFATITTIIILLLLLLILLRKAREIMLIFSPLVLAALLTNTFALFLGIPYNFANIIALPLLFGLGIANGIQLVFRERLEQGSIELLYTSTPKAVLLSATTTIASFSSLALSTHPGTASMGLLLGIAVAVTLIATLFVLPALMATWPRR